VAVDCAYFNGKGEAELLRTGCLPPPGSHAPVQTDCPKEISPSLRVSDHLQGWRSVWSIGPKVRRLLRSREWH